MRHETLEKYSKMTLAQMQSRLNFHKEKITIASNKRLHKKHIDLIKEILTASKLLGKGVRE